MTRGRQAPPRRDGAAQRAARARPDALGRGRPRAGRDDRAPPPGAKPRFTALDGVPGLRGVARLGEAMAVIPLVKTRAARGAAAVPAGERRRAPRRARPIGAGVLRRRARGSVGAEVGAAALVGPARRSSRCAAASSPPTTAPSTRRSARTSRRHRGPHQGARPLRLATSWRRCSPRTSPGVALLKSVDREADAAGQRRGRGRVARRRRRGVRAGPSATPDTARRAGAAASRPRAAARASARASRPPTQLEVGRAALDEILRAEGAVASGDAAAPRRRRLPPARRAHPRRATTPTQYFNLTKELLEREGRHPRVLMQVFQRSTRCSAGSTRRSRSCASAPGAARPTASGIAGWDELEVRALHEGDEIAPYEPS